jgi:hypothetical protein
VLHDASHTPWAKQLPLGPAIDLEDGSLRVPDASVLRPSGPDWQLFVPFSASPPSYDCSCFSTPSPSTPAAAATPSDTPARQRRRPLPAVDGAGEHDRVPGPGGPSTSPIYCSRELQLPPKTCQRHCRQPYQIKNRNEEV